MTIRIFDDKIVNVAENDRHIIGQQKNGSRKGLESDGIRSEKCCRNNLKKVVDKKEVMWII